MELHPDRHYGNVEETTRLFAEVQSAYEVLSDPQERAWYDTHRDSILRNEDERYGGQFEHNMRVTTAEDLVRMFSKFNRKMDFSDSSTGFYSVLRDTFTTLAREEEIACEWENHDPVEYPSFGHANDDYDTVVRPFYAAWNGFATTKSFAWKDVYRYPDAPDRRVRRLMEKENKRFREEGIREFNDAVRSLVAFVRKRDPRFRPNNQSEADRQKILRDAVAAQAARSRAANQTKSAPQGPVPEWMMTREAADDVDDSEESDEAPNEHVECVVCKKSFKSEKQYEAHERSKKHVKAVQQLRRQMERENITLNLKDQCNNEEAESPKAEFPIAESQDSLNVADNQSAGESGSSPNEEQPSDTHAGQVLPTRNSEDYDEEGERGEAFTSRSSDTKGKMMVGDSLSSSSDDEYANRSKVEDRILGQDRAEDLCNKDVSLDLDMGDVSHRFAADLSIAETDSCTQPKLGKAKAKRARKAAQKTVMMTSSDAGFKCAACQAGFPSKTRLFNHIKNLGHAQSIPNATKGEKGKKY